MSAPPAQGRGGKKDSKAKDQLFLRKVTDQTEEKWTSLSPQHRFAFQTERFQIQLFRAR